MNPFEKALENTFRTRRVRVISRDGAEYVGFVERIDWHNRHFILHGAENENGEPVGATLVSHAERVELLDEEKRIERIPLGETAPSPYFAGEFDHEENLDYIERVRNQGVRRSFPVVRPTEDGYETVDGHKALWVCRRAGLSSQPCEVVDLSDWEAACQFVWDHIPSSQHVREDGTTDNDWYSDDGIKTAISELYERWGERILDLHVVEYNVDRLGLTVEA